MKHNSLIPRRNTNSLIDNFFSRDDLFTPLDSLFNDVFKSNFPTLFEDFDVSFEKAAYPKIDMKETKTDYIIKAEIPGIEKENVKIEFDNRIGILKIMGNKRIKKEDRDDEKDAKWIRKEIKESSFCRTIAINPDNIKKEDISADFKDNYLNIKIPKKESKETDNDKIQIEIK